MHIDENAVWQRVAASWEGANGDPLGQALEEARALMEAISALSTGKEPWQELKRSQRQTLRALRGLGRLLGRAEEQGGKHSRLSGKTYGEKLRELISRQEHQARSLENLGACLGSPGARVAEQEARRAWERWHLMLLELGR